MLKLSKAQLEAAAAHVATAVEPDAWLRAYLAPGGAALVYACEQGDCNCSQPTGKLRGGRLAAGRPQGSLDAARRPAPCFATQQGRCCRSNSEPLLLPLF